MPLPYFTNMHNWNNQESTIDLSKEECIILMENTSKIKDDKLFININYSDNINILTILNKLKKFSLDISVYDKLGNIIYKLIYKNCQFIDFIYDITDMDWSSNDILKPEFRIKYEVKNMLILILSNNIK